MTFLELSDSELAAKVKADCEKIWNEWGCTHPAGYSIWTFCFGHVANGGQRKIPPVRTKRPRHPDPYAPKRKAKPNWRKTSTSSPSRPLPSRQLPIFPGE